MTNTSRAGCTIIAGNYLAQARVLANSFRSFHPEAAFFALIIDDADAILSKEEPFTVVRLSELEIPSLDLLCSRYTVRELCTAVKPALLAYLLEQQKREKVLFLDPDILVTASLAPLFDALETADIIVTPHATTPIPREIKPNERDVLRVGAYNLGFIGIKGNDTTHQALRWWDNRLSDGCYEKPEDGLFFDQKWTDLLSGYLDNISVIRDCGYNMAYWNLHERNLSKEHDAYFVNGQPLRFYHFSGFLPEKPGTLTKYDTTHTLDNQALGQLHAHYARLLREAGYDTYRHFPYTPQPVAAIPGAATVSTPSASEPTRISFAERRHSWKPYQRFCRLMRTIMGQRLFMRVRHLLRTLEHPRELARAFSHATGAQKYPGFGLNMAGYIDHTSGVAEALRGNIRAVEAAGIPYTVSSTTGGLERPFRFNMVHVNADQIPVFIRHAGRAYFHDRYSIGYWVWEVKPFPEQWLTHFAPLQEIWTASTFTADIFSAVSPVPVHIIPHVIEVAPRASKTRREFGIPEDRFVFLFIFDFRSVFERKNPLAILGAFRRAFPEGKSVTLVFKSLNAGEYPSEAAQWKEAMKGLPCIHLQETMPRNDIDSLLACCDAYISLHRSEGFGMTIAEAMLLGKPVIATNYGGNVDFMHEYNAFPVRYEEVSLSQDFGPYPMGSTWAEPDLDHAARQMRFVFDHPKETSLNAKRGQATIAKQYSAQAVGTQIKERLKFLERYYL
jgi:glycosyltransferase involved in cell wall biosynthesis